ncbi:MAG: universal stress protein [Candidatus Binatia bacterium]
MKRILCPVDFSVASQEAMTAAEQLAAELKAEIILVHASGAARRSKEEVESADAVRQLQALRVRSSGVVIDHVVHPGPPGEVICWLAENRQCDLIVMGTHGRTGLAHLLLGSVAEYVLRHARCPVVIVRPKAGNEKPLAEPLKLPLPPPKYM